MSQQRPPSLRRAILSNLMWLVGSFVLAFLVWMTALAQRDPIQERRLPERAPIQFLVDDGMLMTNASVEDVALRARGQQSALSVLTTDDITVTADARGLGPGTHAISLTTDVQRERIVLDTIPRQVTLTLERRAARLVPIDLAVTGALPAAYEQGQPVFDMLEVEVRGAESQVERVARAVVSVDVTDARTTVTTSAVPVAVDENGAEVQSLTLEPSVIAVTLPIEPRPDVREVSVQPNLVGVDNLPEGYILTGLDYEPRSVLVSGSASLLEALPETFFTAPIDLRNRTQDFEAVVPVQLPSADLLVLAGGTVTVRLSISTQTASQQFDNIPVEVIGLGDGLSVELTPAAVSLLVTGPQPAIEALRAGDIRIVVDVNQRRAGVYSLVPQAALTQGIPPNVSIAILPAAIDVQIAEAARAPTPTATPNR